MSARMLKYVITPDANFLSAVWMPVGTVVKTVGIQQAGTCLWAEVPNGDEPTTLRMFVTVPTGNEVPTLGRYVGTVFDGPFVWHVYEVTS